MTRFIECKCRKTAVGRCPWASVIKKVVGGFMAFEFEDEYQTWRRQR